MYSHRDEQGKRPEQAEEKQVEEILETADSKVHWNETENEKCCDRAESPS
jgi:hypothetical protein